jgi:hypothetical protein
VDDRSLTFDSNGGVHVSDGCSNCCFCLDSGNGSVARQLDNGSTLELVL